MIQPDPPIDIESTLIDAVDRFAEAEPGSPEAVLALREVEALLRVAVERDQHELAYRESTGLVALIEAFPEGWAALADEARRRIDALGLGWGHPASRPWSAIVQCRAGVPVAPRGELIELPTVARSLRLAAAASLPSDPPWTTLGTGEGWEIAFSEDGGGRPGFLVSGVHDARRVAFVRAEDAVRPEPTPMGLFCAAEPGSWMIRVDGTVLEVLVR